MSSLCVLFLIHTCGPGHLLATALQLHLHLIIVLDIDHRLLPLARRNLTLEHDVNLTVRSALHLRQEEVCRDQASQTSSTPNVAAFAAEISTLYCISSCHRKY